MDAKVYSAINAIKAGDSGLLERLIGADPALCNRPVENQSPQPCDAGGFDFSGTALHYAALNGHHKMARVPPA